jgi:pyruvate dehydrogenase E1 component
MRLQADQIRPFVPGPYTVLGTDGYGRSDIRKNLRRFFEVDRHYVVLAALRALAQQGDIDVSKATEAIEKYSIDTEVSSPWTL